MDIQDIIIKVERFDILRSYINWKIPLLKRNHELFEPDVISRIIFLIKIFLLTIYTITSFVLLFNQTNVEWISIVLSATIVIRYMLGHIQTLNDLRIEYGLQTVQKANIPSRINLIVESTIFIILSSVIFCTVPTTNLKLLKLISCAGISIGYYESYLSYENTLFKCKFHIYD